MDPQERDMTKERRRETAGAILAAILIVGALAITGLLPAPVEAQTASQCVACHTDAAKLKALTPPDPPSEEEGEG